MREIRRIGRRDVDVAHVGGQRRHMRSASAPPSRAALQRARGKRMPQIVQSRAEHSPRLDAGPADQLVKGLFGRDVAECQTTLVDEHRIIVRERSSTREVAFQVRCSEDSAVIATPRRSVWSSANM
jgi:hypothetical protein